MARNRELVAKAQQCIRERNLLENWCLVEPPVDGGDPNGHSIRRLDRPEGLIIEDDEVHQLVVEMMLEAGVPVMTFLEYEESVGLRDKE